MDFMDILSFGVNVAFINNSLSVKNIFVSENSKDKERSSESWIIQK